MPANDSTGLHHVTAITGDAQANLDFYTGTLGLRLVKKTVNFDDPDSYHFYYGDEVGRPGTVVTFFVRPGARRGRVGNGQATTIRLSIPAAALSYWQRRLEEAGVAVEPSATGSGLEALVTRDPDGLRLELVGSDDAASLPAWDDGSVPPEHAVRGLHSVVLSVSQPSETAYILDGFLGFDSATEAEGARRLVAAASRDPGCRVDLVDSDAPRGEIAAGSVHHVAFRAAGDAEQLALRRALIDAGLRVTEVRERDYFRSIYFREPNGVLFEVATDGPGFAVDEPVDSLGGALKLPDWLEERRAEIEAQLPEVEVPEPADKLS